MSKDKYIKQDRDKRIAISLKLRKLREEIEEEEAWTEYCEDLDEYGEINNE